MFFAMKICRDISSNCIRAK